MNRKQKVLTLYARYSQKAKQRVSSFLPKREIPPEVLAQQEANYVENLQLLNDTLAAGPLNERYWVWGGLLIGWAREGHPMKHDLQDADFAINAEDEALLQLATKDLIAAGFEPLQYFVNNEGKKTEFCFQRDGVKLEFFLLRKVNDQFVYNTYRGKGGRVDKRRLQVTSAIAYQELCEFKYLQRTWNKVQNHDDELTRLYGNWRKPDKNYVYWNDCQAIIKTDPWTGDVYAWDGSF